MADAYTQTSSISSDVAAYSALAFFALRPQLYFDSVADVKPVNMTHTGSSATWTLWDDIAAATTALGETTDPDAVALSDAQVTVTPLEYGNAVLTTAKARHNSLLNIDKDAANIIGYNAGLSIDTLAQAKIEAGTNVRYAGTATARNEVDATNDKLTANNVRRARVDLLKANVMPFGNLYASFIHPDSAYDLRIETGEAAWRQPHVYVQVNEIWNGEIGTFEGFRFVETPRAPLFADAGNGTGGAGTIDVYGTLFLGQQAFACAHGMNEEYGRYPTIVLRPPVDKLMRFHSVGWKSLIQYGVFRQAALRRVESASSIGSN